MTPGYLFRPMDDEDAREIAGWRYDPPYDFYDAASDRDDLEELWGPRRREDAYFSVSDEEDTLAGFLQFEQEDGIVEVGLGPDLTGKGLGLAFVLAGLGFAGCLFAPTRFRLSMATFNGRAIRLYERASFRRARAFMHHTDGCENPFSLMTREA